MATTIEPGTPQTPLPDTDSTTHPQQAADGIPPDGDFGATIHYSTSGDRVVLQFDVAYPGGSFLHERQIKHRSDKGRKFLAAVRRNAGLSEADDDVELEGKRVTVCGQRRFLRGKLTWVPKRFRKLAESQERESVEPGIEPDEKDVLADQMMTKLDKIGARFARDGDTVLILPPGHGSIPMDHRSTDYAALQHRLTGVGTAEYKGKILAQRVTFKVMQRAERFRRVLFSHAHEGQVLVPVEGGKVLRITAEGFTLVENGTDGVWLEHPQGLPMAWLPDADPREGMEKFEELLIRTQTVTNKMMRFVVGVALGIVPFVRQLVRTRPITELYAPHTRGKTTTAERFLRVNRLGGVKGDYSDARLQRDGDVGLVVLDNVETRDLTRSKENSFIYVSTGGEWGRVGTDKNANHPVIAITTVEGAGKRPEVARRLLTVDCYVEAAEVKNWSENAITAAIEEHRGLIFRGVAEVIQRTLAQRHPPLPNVIPLDTGFTDYCRFVYRLLRAWEEVAGKPAGFADGVFEEWDRQRHSTDHAEDSAGAYPRWLDYVLGRFDRMVMDDDPIYGLITRRRDYKLGPHAGDLYVAEPRHWLTALKDVAARERDYTLPAKAEGLRHRLMELTPDKHGFKLITEKDDPASLKRTGQRRRWGILKVSSDEPSSGNCHPASD